MPAHRTHRGKEDKGWRFPVSASERLEAMARETARMSYPSSMSRGRRPLVKSGTKKAVEEFFVNCSLLHQMLAGEIEALEYDRWHQQVSEKMVEQLGHKSRRSSCRVGVANKLVDTFMHQAMKYGDVRHLWPRLHLPLDRIVMNRLRMEEAKALKPIQAQLGGSAYELSYQEYQTVQSALDAWRKELNARPDMGFKLTSRIELNWIWALNGRT